ncbi:TPA: NAD(P)H-dependent oxidoreductase [bacterium]|nr:NAD(P)H-dependent oxidoreductase [bacterium]
MDKIKLIGLSGSLRKGSYNTLLLENTKKLLPEGVELEIVDISNIPFFSEDLEANDYPKVVEELNQKLGEADGFVIATPEYNFSYAPVVKNALDWASRAENAPLFGKHAAIISASPSPFGGARGQYHLRQVFVSLNLIPVNKPEVMVMSSHNKFDENGNLTDEFALKLLKELVHNLVDDIKKGKK